MAVWLSGNEVVHINEVTLLRPAWLVGLLGWLQPFAGIPSWYLTSHSGLLPLRG